MASQESEALKTLYRGWAAALAANPEMPLDELRLMFEHWGDVTAEPGGVDYIEANADGVPALWAVPKGCAEDRVLLCMHGGGYVTASMYTHRKVYGHLAKAIGCRALIPHYRRAPEHVHPAPVDDAVTAYRWLLDQGVEPGHIALTGDSAGGALAVTTLLRARERNLPMPAATMPLSPWVDMEITGETLVSNREKDAIVQREVVEVMRRRQSQGPVGEPALCRPQGFAAGLHPGGRRRDAIGRQPPARRACQEGRRGCQAGRVPGVAARLPFFRRTCAGSGRRDPQAGRMGAAEAGPRLKRFSSSPARIQRVTLSRSRVRRRACRPSAVPNAARFAAAGRRPSAG